MRTIYFRSIKQTEINELKAPKRGSWVNVVEPDNKELHELAEEFDLEFDLLKDGVDLYESPRLEREDGTLYVYTRYCRPSGEYTSTHPLLLVITPELLITISRITADPVQRLLQSGKVVTTQKIKLVLELLEELNKGYHRHLNTVTKDILSTRNKLQRTIVNNDDILTFIDIEEDLNEFLTALQPYSILLHAILNGKYMKLHEEDEDLIEDLQLSASELIELTKSRLKTIQNIRDAYTTIATNNLNKIFKRLTSIAIFLAIPTVIGGLYGMNILLPFANEEHAFLIVLTIIFVTTSGFVLYFKRHHWL